jgi:hypothetical protein
MGNELFAFTLCTKQRFDIHAHVFDKTGGSVGRILHKYPTFKDRYEEFEYEGSYSYDVESLKETYEKIECNEIVLNIEDYSVHRCSTYYTNI